MKKPDFMTFEQWLKQNPDMMRLHNEDPEQSECHGNGLVTCPDCAGKGHFDCEACEGTGEIDPALALYQEQLMLDKQKLERFIQFHKTVTGSELVFDNT